MSRRGPIVATLLTLTLLEGAARTQETGVVYPFDQPGRGYAVRPGARDSNRYGFHERDIPPGRDASLRRVVVLGDSMTYGTTTADECWTRVAEERLGAPWQILNFAQYSYDAAQSAATLRYVASRWEPDVVVFATYTNDLVPTTINLVGPHLLPVWTGEGGLLPPLLRRSAVLRFAEGAALRGRASHVAVPSAYRAAVADMAEQASGVPFVVFGLLPHVFAGSRCDADEDFCAKHRERFATQAAIVRELGVPWISAEPILAAAPEETYFPALSSDPEHPNPDGHRVLGEGFAAALGPVLVAADVGR